MILTVNRYYGQTICFSSSNLLWVSEDVTIEKDGIDVLDKTHKSTGQVTPIWRAYFSVCIFGKDPFVCENSFGRGIVTSEEATKDKEFLLLKSQHEQLIKVLSEKK